MRHTDIYKPFLWCFGMVLFAGCAQIVAPSGGPKDTTPPKVVSSSPENKSTHFNTRKILIGFNKYIQLKDISSQLVVSPPLKYFPVTRIKKGRVLEIILKDTLQENTTYTFNFGNAVCDLNEGNVLPNFHYVFSTGSYVDSLSLTGQLNDAFTLDPQKDALVMLYSNLSDSAPYKKLPSYIARSDANGFYRIENVKPGTYRLVALSKSQGDYFYHPYGESMGFSGHLLDIQRNDTANLFMFTEVEQKLHLLKARAIEKGKIQLIFNRPADSLAVKLLNLPATATTPYTFMKYSATKDSATYWINTPGLDSLRFIISRNNINIDTAAVYSFPGSTNKKNTKPASFRILTNIQDKQADVDYNKPIILQILHPISKYDIKRIRLMQRKDSVPFKVDTSALPFALTLKTSLISDSSYQLFIPPGTFTDVFGGVNDTLNIHFKVVEPTYFGSLKLGLRFARPSNYLVQLLDDKNNAYKQDKVGGDKDIMYDALPPGNYRIRVIEDVNGNGTWDTGNYLKGIQPERVYYFSQIINIRSNWDLTQEWLVK